MPAVAYCLTYKHALFRDYLAYKWAHFKPDNHGTHDGLPDTVTHSLSENQVSNCLPHNPHPHLSGLHQGSHCLSYTPLSNHLSHPRTNQHSGRAHHAPGVELADLPVAGYLLYRF
uniref:Uncharacterized protein n=1 Tax=Pyramimonas obovata TaxID=1411642 RepID=A0A7S0QVR6_9CHLO|mmetsp:Transcript_13147/g.27864  ORF Transcript_13147/g.27864 Transcript_13147/m.27864 type:complete len:115 (+) Transcript_13147:67-411(+)